MIIHLISDSETMPSNEEYLDKCLHRMNNVGFVATRPLMGDYILYVEDRPIGGIYDDCFYLAICDASEAALGDSQKRTPCVGHGEMLLVPDDMDSEKLSELIRAMIQEIPIPKACRRFSLGR